MAKNNNKNVETKVVETKVEETKVEENVSRETSVSGTTNNVGQEIVKQAPSTDVVTCTMTDEEHQARKDRIHEKQAMGLKISWDIMVDIVSAKERKEQALDGYDETEKAFEQWCETEFNIKSTQVRQAVRVLTTYGKVDDKGEWSLEDKYKRYTKEKLDIIQRHPQFKTRASFDNLVDGLGITPATSEDVLKQLVREAKGLPEPTPKEPTKKSQKSEETKVAPSVEDIKASDTYKHVEDTKAVVMKFASNMFIEANKVLESKDNKLAMAYVQRFIEAFKDMEKQYNEVGKEPQAESTTEETTEK